MLMKTKYLSLLVVALGVGLSACSKKDTLGGTNDPLDGSDAPWGGLDGPLEIRIDSATAVTLSFGVTSDLTFWNWFADMKGNTRNRQHLSIYAYGRMDLLTNRKLYAQWDLNYAWPCKISGLNFDLDSDAAFIAEVTLMHEGITRVA